MEGLEAIGNHGKRSLGSPPKRRAGADEEAAAPFLSFSSIFATRPGAVGRAQRIEDEPRPLLGLDEGCGMLHASWRGL